MSPDATLDPTEQTTRGFFRNWIADTDWFDAIDLLEMLPTRDNDRLVLILARAMHAHTSLNASKVQALALTVMLFNGNAIDPLVDLDDASEIAVMVDDLLGNRVRGMFATRQQAAFAAVRQLGTAVTFGVSDAVEAELGDTSREARTSTLDLVDRIAAARHSWYIRHDQRIGWVLFHTTED